MTIRFQDTLNITTQFIEAHYSSVGCDPIVIRNIYGRISVIVQCEKNQESEKFSIELAEKLGNFAYMPNNTFIYADDVFAFEAIINSPDKLTIPETNPPIYLIDKQITGQDWLRPQITENRKIPRVTLFGIKGGVGRSTALAMLAWDLARQGKKVLIIDLDLESPGIGQILLPKDYLADYGVVDWLVEQAVGQADTELLTGMVAVSPLAQNTTGEIKIIATAGKNEGDYLAKLSRVYMDITIDNKTCDFANRLAFLLKQLEEKETPDIVLLDSRAGIHDIAASAITRLSDLALLFAVNTPQTWQAYEYLFSHWQKWNKNLIGFRENLKIVAAMVPELDETNYLNRLNESAYNLFTDTIYEEIQSRDSEEETESDDLDYFNFDVNDSQAPHFPIKILWNRRFQEFNPQSENYFTDNEEQIKACYGSFLNKVNELIDWHKS
jgi:Mrp family chromosome partitioning ATPase